MKTENITLTMQEQNKVQTISLLQDGQIEVPRAKEILGCSERTLFRWKACLKQKGPAGLIHGNRGRASPCKTAEKVIQRILTLYHERYFDANDSHFTELLERFENIKIGRATLRRILRTNRIAAKRKRRAPRYRSRRPRKEAFGTMLQLDASSHQWLGSLGPWLALHGAIDDATGTVWAHFEELETTYGYFELMRQVFADKGLPLSLYTDRHSIFYPVNPKLCAEQQRQNQKSLTQFGRAMSELGIEMIPAYSPQAKGRIERLWDTFQDRLTVEMRLGGIYNKNQAQEFLKDFLVGYNAKYAIKAHQRQSVFRKCPRKTVLDDILCHKEFRVVNNDHTVSYQGHILQIPRLKGWRTLVKKTVEIWDRADGIIKIAMQGKILQIYKQPTEGAFYDIAA